VVYRAVYVGRGRVPHPGRVQISLGVRPTPFLGQLRIPETFSRKIKAFQFKLIRCRTTRADGKRNYNEHVQQADFVQVGSASPSYLTWVFIALAIAAAITAFFKAFRMTGILTLVGSQELKARRWNDGSGPPTQPKSVMLHGSLGTLSVKIARLAT